MNALFELDDFSVAIGAHADAMTAIAENITLRVDRGQTLCIVGESGSGKSVTMLSAVRLLEEVAPVRLSGHARLDGVELTELTQEQMADVRGARIGFIFQEAMEALNPTQTIATQLAEAALVTRRTRASTDSSSDARAAAVARALDLLAEVEIHDPERVMSSYPHQLSGGMQQRVMIAMALMGDPDLLVADEPTTALDVTVQAEVLRLLNRLRHERNMACVLITHDMGVASEIADRIAVLYAGQLVEIGPVRQMLEAPQHAYTKALLQCVPRPGVRLQGRMPTIVGAVPAPGTAGSGDRFAPRNPLADQRSLTQAPPVIVSEDGAHMVRAWEPVLTWTDEMVARLTHQHDATAIPVHTVSDEILVDLRHVSKTYGTRPTLPTRSRAANAKYAARPTHGVRAVADLDLQIRAGEFFGVVGETGSGKSTLGRMIMDLERADPSSSLSVAGYDLRQRRTFAGERAFRRAVQMVFQNPQDSLDPRRTIAQAIAEPLHSLLKMNRADARRRVSECLDAVGLPYTAAAKYPSEVSGGQRQRVAIARAIATKPRLIVADEPTSALDVSVQGQIVNLMLDLQAELGLTYVFITHNLSLITAIADRVGVMYRGELVEVATAEQLLRAPAHEYSRTLLASNPDPFSSLV